LGLIVVLVSFRKTVTQIRQSNLEEPILMAELALPQQEEPNLVPFAPLAEAEE
jgi:hypothetical protein